jgi:hypothetical protein
MLGDVPDLEGREWTNPSSAGDSIEQDDSSSERAPNSDCGEMATDKVEVADGIISPVGETGREAAKRAGMFNSGSGGGVVRDPS